MFTQKIQELSNGVIRAGELYTLVAFKRCLSLTDSALRALRIKGLPIIKFGKRKFVSGSKAIEFLEKNDGDRRQG